MSITDTLCSCEFPTYTRVPAGFTATPLGPNPTAIVSVTSLVAVSITNTMELP